MDRQIVEQLDLIDIAEHLRRTGTYYVTGSYSISVPSQGIKYLNKRVVKPWPDLEGYTVQMLPGEAARTELRREWPDIKRLGWTAPMIKLFDKRVPMYYAGAKMCDMTQIDLTGAYYQLYRSLWLDTPYPCGYYGKYPLRAVADRLEPWKVARNALVGIARSRFTVGIKGDRRYTLSTTNHYLSPGLWATIADCLHYLAQAAINWGAFYVNTDGYIFPYDRDVDRFTDLLNVAGLRYHLIEGEGEIRCWNSYKIGTKSTKPYRLNLIQQTKGFSNVTRQHYDWLGYLNRCERINRPGASTQSGVIAGCQPHLYKTDPR